MAEPADMIVPLFREMCVENLTEHERTRDMLFLLEKRLGSVETAQKSFTRALTADTLLSKLLTGEFEERISAPARKMRDLETHK